MSAQERAPAIEVRDLTKDYRALRPLRIKHLSVAEGDRVALVGFDAPGAEVLVNLLTGASLPDSGDVRVFGQSTASIGSSDEWLAMVDRFGIVSERVVLLEALTVAQNLALPLTLDLDPPPPAAMDRIGELSRETGLNASVLESQAGAVSPLDRARIRLGRALALNPLILLLEHPTATLSASETSSFGADVRRTATSRGLTLLALTADEQFASACDARAWRWQPASGDLSPQSILGAMVRVVGRTTRLDRSRGAGENRPRQREEETMSRFARVTACLVVIVVLTVALLWTQASAMKMQGGAAIQAGPTGFVLPRGLQSMPIPVPPDNPMTAGKIKLGEQLFFDKRLSRTKQMSCETCHVPEKGWTDGLALSPRFDGSMNTRHTPTLYGTAYYPDLYWDGRCQGTRGANHRRMAGTDGRRSRCDRQRTGSDSCIRRRIPEGARAAHRPVSASSRLSRRLSARFTRATRRGIGMPRTTPR